MVATFAEDAQDGQDDEGTSLPGDDGRADVSVNDQPEANQSPAADSDVRSAPDEPAEEAVAAAPASEPLEAEFTAKSPSPSAVGDATAQASAGAGKGEPKANSKAPPTKSRFQLAAERLDDKIARVQAELAAKERLVLCYVFQKTPSPIYERWKEEANEIFASLVTLKQRRFEMTKRRRV
jgi:hypothetical protein